MDRDEDKHYDAIELTGGSNPADANSVPLPFAVVTKVSTNLVLSWTSTPGAIYTPEVSVFLTTGSWFNAASPTAATSGVSSVNLGAPGSPRRFYRVRLTK